jgi:Flp pilus assembly protein TadG
MKLANPACSRERRGTVAAIVAVSLTALLGVLAIGLDGGLLLTERRRAQSTADAAALAAAADLYKNYSTNQGTDPSGTAKQAALNLASANGYANDGTNSTVTVNIPPLSGSYKGQAGYAEVIVQFNEPRAFSAIFGSGTMPVGFRAVAGGNPGGIGILILDPSSTDTCEIDGTLKINGNGDILVNSTDPAAIRIYDTGSITAKNISVAGSPGLQNNVGSGAVNATVITGAAAAADPLASIPEPVPSGTNYGSVTVSGGTIQPGIYTSINIAAGANVTMAPGIYYLSSSSGWSDLGGIFGFFAGVAGITVNSGATLTGTGVMIYNQSGDNLDFYNAGAINLTPPTSGTYKGISLFQPRSDTTEMHFISSNNVTISGTLYAPAGIWDLRPMGTAVFNMANYIGWQFEACQGGTDFGVGGSTSGTVNLTPSGGAGTQKIRLVE